MESVIKEIPTTLIYAVPIFIGVASAVISKYKDLVYNNPLNVNLQREGYRLVHQRLLYFQESKRYLNISRGVIFLDTTAIFVRKFLLNINYSTSLDLALCILSGPAAYFLTRKLINTYIHLKTTKKFFPNDNSYYLP